MHGFFSGLPRAGLVYRIAEVGTNEQRRALRAPRQAGGGIDLASPRRTLRRVLFLPGRWVGTNLAPEEVAEVWMGGAQRTGSRLCQREPREVIGKSASVQVEISDEVPLNR